MKKYLLLIPILATACASTIKYDRSLDRWKGTPASRFIATWGPPNSIDELPNGNKTMTWYWSGSGYVDAVYSRRSVNSSWCKTEFTVAPNGDISSWSRTGANCWEK